MVKSFSVLWTELGRGVIKVSRFWVDCVNLAHLPVFFNFSLG